MNELLKQALWLTVMGMGMTFLAIGALVGLMYLITALAPEKAEEAGEEGEPLAVAESPLAEAEDRYRAAAAAVILALTLEKSRLHRAEGQSDDPWTIYARSQKLRRSL